MRILLMGSPNVGKSAIFSRLTGANVIVSNYSGTTVEYTAGRLKLGGESAEVIDVPGTYDLQPTSRAEQVAVEMLARGDVIVNVVDATNIERNLNLTVQLLKTDKPVVIALNMWDEAVEHGVEIDVQKLEEMLGVPVVPTCALSGEGILKLTERLSEARRGTLTWKDEDKWKVIGDIVDKVQRVTHHHPTLGQRLGHLSVHPVLGPFLALVILVLSFQTVRFAGEALITHVFDPLFQKLWMPVVSQLSVTLGGSGVIHNLLIGELVNGGPDSRTSFGLLTTGLYIELAQVLPYIIAFYLVLGIIEDAGYLPRLGVLMDNVMHRLGLHGLAVVPMMLGLGCNVPGVLAARVLETRRERFIAVTLMCICVPCMAQIAMIAALLGRYGAAGLVPVFGTLFVLWVLLGMIMKRLGRGETPEILVDIPPYRFPYWKALLKKLLMRIKWFLLEAAPFVLLGIVFVNALRSLGVIGWLSGTFGPFLAGAFGLPPQAMGALIVGFLRKDVAVGMLAPLGLNLHQLIVACVVLTTYFPCAAAFVVVFRELGFRDMLKCVCIMLTVALGTGVVLNQLLRLIGL